VKAHEGEIALFMSTALLLGRRDRGGRHTTTTAPAQEKKTEEKAPPTIHWRDPLQAHDEDTEHLMEQL
jgi:hypothetical protein